MHPHCQAHTGVAAPRWHPLREHGEGSLVNLAGHRIEATVTLCILFVEAPVNFWMLLQQSFWIAGVLDHLFEYARVYNSNIDYRGSPPHLYRLCIHGGSPPHFYRLCLGARPRTYI